MATIGNNERSYAIDLISEINLFCNNKDLRIKKANGERTIFNSEEYNNITRNIMFPDILLYSNNNQTDILQGWEIKMPDVPITDTTFIDDAIYKANALGLESTILWNFNTAALYVKRDDSWKLYKQWNDMNSLKTRKDVDENSDIWKTFLYDLLVELNEFILTGLINERELSAVTDNVISTIVNQNKSIVGEYLQKKSISDRSISSKINLWWQDTKKEFLDDENDSFTAYSKIILLSWINRFIFAHVIKSFHNSAYEIIDVKYDPSGKITHSPEDVNKIFMRITQVSDFYTIFEPKQFDEFLPHQVWKQLIDFNIFFADKTPGQELLQDLLEGTVNRNKRLVNGQFTTPKNLARLLVRITTKKTDGKFIDPCAATGTIPNQILELVTESISFTAAHNNIWASDKQKFVLQFANLSMTNINSINLINQVFASNVFDLKPSDEIVFRSPINGKEITKILPFFDTVLSNLPFIQFENHSSDENEIIEDLVKKIENKTNIKLSRRSDYYYYIIFFLHSLINNEGRLGVITSNSWLATESGMLFFKALTHYFKIDNIVMSGDKKWFKNADVVTCILVLDKKENISINNDDSITFTLINTDINELENNDLDLIADTIFIKEKNSIVSFSDYTYEQIENYLNYRISLNTLFYDIDWFENITESLIPLTNKFDVIRGKRKGWNAMFYPKSGNHNIEEDYLIPVVRSSTEIKKYNHSATSKAFSTSLTINQIRNKQHNGALNWIEKFSKEVNGKGIPLKDVLSNSKEEWYQMLPDGSLADFGTSINPFKRLFWSKFDSKSFLDQRIIGLSLKEENSSKCDKELLHALLNSILSLFFIEAAGFGRGLGALDINKTSLEQTYILNPDILSEENKKI